MNKTIYKILASEQWNELQLAGESEGAPIDIADGYVHFSNAAQLQETADKHFKGQDDLQLIAMSVDTLGDELKWEASRGGDLFPHLYAKLRLSDVLWAKPMPLVAGTHALPKLD